MLNNSITSSKPTPITKQNWPENSEPLVSISCITFNHENFIRDAIEGFLIQRTTFPVEILIHDDASTDKTQEIIREYEEKYPFLIRPIYQKTNQYSQGNSPGKFNRERAKGKYYAICEGDDYWTDPLKLQKQVEFLEGNEEYVVCGTKYQIKKEHEKNLRLDDGPDIEGKELYFFLDVLYGRAVFRTCTLMLRRQAVEGFKPIKGVINSDKLLMLHVLKNGGKGANLPFISSVYRQHQGGVWTSGTQIKLLSSYFNMFLNYRDFIPLKFQKDARLLLKGYGMKLLAEHVKKFEFKSGFHYLKYFRVNSYLLKGFFRQKKKKK